MSDIERETLQAMPKGWQLPIINIVPRTLIKNAESKLAQVFGPIAESKESQEALRLLEEYVQKNPNLSDMFVFDAAEKTMYAPMIKEKINILEQLGPKELESVKSRIKQNMMAYDQLFKDLSPEARKPVMEAFQAAQQIGRAHV